MYNGILQNVSALFKLWCLVFCCRLAWFLTSDSNERTSFTDHKSFCNNGSGGLYRRLKKDEQLVLLHELDAELRLQNPDCTCTLVTVVGWNDFQTLVLNPSLALDNEGSEVYRYVTGPCLYHFI